MLTAAQLLIAADSSCNPHRIYTPELAAALARPLLTAIGVWCPVTILPMVRIYHIFEKKSNAYLDVVRLKNFLAKKGGELFPLRLSLRLGLDAPIADIAPSARASVSLGLLVAGTVAKHARAAHNVETAGHIDLNTENRHS